MEAEQLPQLKGVVIITLPPADNPSLGKTITAYTLSDSPPSPSHHQPPEQPYQTPHPPTPPPPPPPQERRFSLRFRTLIPRRRFVFRLLTISLIALIICFFRSSKTLSEFLNSNDDRNEPKSFVFPLYPKLGLQRDIELKLGRFGAKLNDGLREKKIEEFVSTTGAVHSTSVLPVRGNIYPDGLYFTHMLVGSPPELYFLDVDTGSDLTWIQCDAPCISCAKGAHPLYKPTKVKIVPPRDTLCVEVQRNQKNVFCEKCTQCDYEIEYADQSSSMGVLAKDEFHLPVTNGSLTKSSVVFGCAYDQQGLLLNSLTKTDGILGLSKAKVSLPFQLTSQGIVDNVIGHCISTNARVGGYMFLGDGVVPYSIMAWIPMLNRPSTSFYEAEVTGLSYGRSQLGSGDRNDGAGRVVFDSGSSYTYFAKQAYLDLVASLRHIPDEDLIMDMSDPTLPVCWRAKHPIRSVMDVERFFKPITLQFGGKWWMISRKLRILPEGYLIISNNGNVCLGILDGSDVHDGSTFILGDISLRGRLVVYDNMNHRIGWAKSDCGNPRRSNSVPFLGGMDLGIDLQS